MSNHKVTADKDEIDRLNRELQICHDAYIRQASRLDYIAQELAKQIALVESLRLEINSAVPRLAAAKEFVASMVAADTRKDQVT